MLELIKDLRNVSLKENSLDESGNIKREFDDRDKAFIAYQNTGRGLDFRDPGHHSMLAQVCEDNGNHLLRVINQTGKKNYFPAALTWKDASKQHTQWGMEMQQAQNPTNRMAARLPQGRPTCQKCGMLDDGTNTVVSSGKCRDTNVCEERQAAIANGTLELPKPAVKKRKPPYVDRKGMAPCAHEDCLKEGKRFPAAQMSWFPSPVPHAYCSDHFLYASNSRMDYNTWKARYKRR